MERLVPPRRDRPVTVELPRIETAADVVAASSALIEAAASGAIRRMRRWSNGEGMR